MADDNKPQGDQQNNNEKPEEKDDKKSKSGDTTSTEVEEDDDEEDEEEEAEKTEALNLLRALKDPKNGRRVIEILAREAGFEIGEKSKRETKDEILEVLSEHLGKDYEFLAPKLGPAIKSLLNGMEQKFESRLAQLGEKNVQEETDNAIEELTREFPDFKLFTKKIVSLTKDLTPTKGMSQKKYLTQLYHLAKSQTRGSNKDERKSRSIGDLTSRLSPIGGDDKSNSKLANSRPSRRQAIEAAMQELVDASD